jgi:PAS domain S-box-containing protein
MEIISSVLKQKWNKIQIEKKLLFGFIISILMIVLLSFFWMESKIELRKNVALVVENAALRVSIHKLIIALNQVESKQNVLLYTESSAKDTESYLASISNLKASIINLEKILNKTPKANLYLDSLKHLINFNCSIPNVISKPLKNSEHGILFLDDSHLKKIYKDLEMIDELAEQKSLAYSNRFYNQSNRNIYFEILLIISSITALTLFYTFLLGDVRKRRKLTQELSENRTKLKAIIDTTPAMIFVKDLNRNFTLVNKSFEATFGITEGEILMKDNSKIVSDEDFLIAKKEDELVMTEGKIIWNIERPFILPDKSKMFVSINKAPLFDENHDVIGLVGVMDDITKRKVYEDEIEKSREELVKINSQKDKFFSIIAHDLRSPFAGMLGLSELLLEEYPDFSEDERKYYIRQIHFSLKNLLSLVDNLLTWARLQINRIDFAPEEVNLKEIIFSVFQTQQITANNKKISLNSNLEHDINIFADPDMIETVIRNLVSNAIKFTNSDGAINVNVINFDDSVTVEVEDNGIGMSKEVANNLFNLEKKVTTKGTNNEQGTGLGLIICKEFIERHKGTILVKSELGVGTTISFTIPKNKDC